MLGMWSFFLAGICFKTVLDAKGALGTQNFLSYLRVFSSWIGECWKRLLGVGWSHNPWNCAQNVWMRTRFSGDHRGGAGWWLDSVTSEDFSNLNNSMILNAQFKEFEFYEWSKLECHP